MNNNYPETAVYIPAGLKWSACEYLFVRGKHEYEAELSELITHLLLDFLLTRTQKSRSALLGGYNEQG